MAEVQLAGVRLRLIDGVVKIKGTPSHDLLARVREYKTEIIAILSCQACIDCDAVPVAFELGGFGTGWWRCSTCLKRHLYLSDLRKSKRLEAAGYVEKNSTTSTNPTAIMLPRGLLS